MLSCFHLKGNPAGKIDIQMLFGNCTFCILPSLMCTGNIKIHWFCVLTLETLDFQQWCMCESLFLFLKILFGFLFMAVQDF